jgi:hypothetical protein
MKKNMFSTLAAVLLMAFALTSCSGDTPSEVVKGFFSNMKSGNVEEAVRYLDVDEAYYESAVNEYSRVLERHTGTSELYKEGEIKTITEEVNGDEAEVEVYFTVYGFGQSVPVNLKKIDGNWKITSKLTRFK